MSEKKVGKRLLTWVLVLVMTLSLLPLNVLANGGDSGADPGKVTAKKECSGPDSYGNYTITLTVRGTPVSSSETTTTSANADVVLVVDNSGSMSSSVGTPCREKKDKFETGYKVIYTCPTCGAQYWFWDVPDVCTGQTGVTKRITAAKQVSKEFASSILSYTGNQVAVFGFSHGSDKGGTDKDAIKVPQGLTDNKGIVENAIDKMKADGGTNYTAALQEAYNYLNGRSATDKQTRPGYVIFISDGAPGLSGESQDDPDWNGSNQAENIKGDGYTLYTVGIALEGPAETYLKNMASADQNEHFINVTGNDYADTLSTVLKQWADKIKVTPTTKPAGTKAVLTDVINTEKFDYVADSATGGDLTVSEDSEGNKTVTWDIGEIPEDTTSVSFMIKAWDGVWGDNIPTNKDVNLTYTAANGNNVTKTKNEIGDPKVDIPAPQVTLTFNANGGSWKTAVEGYTMDEDNKIASISGEKGVLKLLDIGTHPTRERYTFKGWYASKEDANKLSSEVAFPGISMSNSYTLYAGWKEIESSTNFSCKIVQHFIDADGKSSNIDKFTSNAIAEDTLISDLIAEYAKNQGTYWYNASETKVNGATPTENQKLIEDSIIDLYYYLDTWNDKDDSISGGDNIPDMYQVLVKFESANPLYGKVEGKTTQVFTGKDAEDKYVSSFDVTPDMSGITCTPTAPQYKFLKWTRDDKDVEDPGAMIKDVPGGSTIVFQAQWDTNKYTLTYDANGGTLNSSMTSPVTNIASGANVSLDYSNQPTHDKQDGKNVIFIGWTGTGTDKKVYTNGEELPDLMMQATFVNSDITVHAVWGLDDNGNGVPDALEAKVTYKVENGYWYDAATGKAAGSEIVCLRPLYKKSASGVWEPCNATLGDSIPTGRAGNAGYTADGWYKDAGTTTTTIDAATPVTGNVTYTFKYVPETKPDTYTVVLHLDGGTYTTAPEYTKTTDGYQYCLRKATDKVNPTITTLNKNGYQFKGWSLSETAPQALIGADETFTSLSVQQNGLNGPHNEINLYAVWQEIKYTVTYNLDGGTTTSDKTIFPDLTYGVDTPTIATPTKAGYTFAGWNPEVAKTVTKDVTYKAKWNTNYVPYYPPVPPTVKIEDDDALGLNTTDHFAYIVGYGNGEVRPQNNITRAEVATIFFRLLTDDVRDENLTKTNRYSDVAATSWYNTAVSTLSSMGIITGYPDGTFRPNAAITRAEFAAIAARFDNDGDKTAAKFSDIATHWAKDEISIAYNNGWITGYPNGTFGPQRDITRAETMTLVNRVLNRQPETEDDLLPNMTVWTDNANPKAWYYLAVQEATNSHYYEFKTNSKYEKWTELRETRDWTQLEK